MTGERILIVEDELYTSQALESLLIILGYQPIGSVTSGTEAILKAEQELPDLVLMDIVLEGTMDGIEAAKRITTTLDIPIIYITAYKDMDTIGKAKMTEPSGYIIKPVTSPDDIMPTIELALYNHKTQSKSTDKLRKIQAIIAEGPNAKLSKIEAQFPITPIPVEITTELLFKYQKTYEALNNPDRLKILEAITDEAKDFQELKILVDKSPATLSHHLKILEGENLLISLRKGKSSAYEITDSMHRTIQLIKTQFNKSLSEMMGFFEALGNNERLKMLDSLRQKPQTYKDFEEHGTKAFSTITHHLRILQREGLILPIKKGRLTQYTLAKDLLAKILSIF
jgi:CheY-like chemotaxis protein